MCVCLCLCLCVCVCERESSGCKHTEWAFIFRAFQCGKPANFSGPFTNPSLRTKHSSPANITICYLKQVSKCYDASGCKSMTGVGLEEEDMLAWLIMAIYWLGHWTQLCIDTVNTAVLSDHTSIGGLIQMRKHTHWCKQTHTQRERDLQYNEFIALNSNFWI